MTMKLYKFEKLCGERAVTVDGKELLIVRRQIDPPDHLHPERFARTVLFDVLGCNPPGHLVRDFHTDIIEHCEIGDSFTDDEVREWVNFIWRLGKSVDLANITGNRNRPTDTVPLIMPRILRLKKNYV
jgi:hypothetical protein